MSAGILMSYGTFQAILITGASLSTLLICTKMLMREMRKQSYSWFAVPLPFFIAWIIATWPYVKAALEWHQ